MASPFKHSHWPFYSFSMFVKCFCCMFSQDLQQSEQMVLDFFATQPKKQLSIQAGLNCSLPDNGSAITSNCYALLTQPKPAGVVEKIVNIAVNIEKLITTERLQQDRWNWSGNKIGHFPLNLAVLGLQILFSLSLLQADSAFFIIPS